MRVSPSGSSGSYYLPNLSHVIFRDRADDKWFVRIPGEIGDLRRVTAMNELQVRDSRKHYPCRSDEGLFTKSSGGPSSPSVAVCD